MRKTPGDCASSGLKESDIDEGGKIYLGSAGSHILINQDVEKQYTRTSSAELGAPKVFDYMYEYYAV